MTGKEKLLIFSPFLPYGGYLLHLSVQDGRPFLMKWIEGCFGLFLTLVLCNVFRKAVADRRAREREEGEEES